MSSKARTLARRLLRENRGTRSKPARSWREIAREDFNGAISHATICRFAISEGEWIPKDRELQIALGVRSPRKPKPQQQPAIFDMSTSVLRQALMGRTEMPPVDARIIREFKRLGWIRKVKS